MYSAASRVSLQRLQQNPLEQRRAQRGDAPPVMLSSPAHVQTRDVPVSSHALETYDQLKERADE
jgi:hypothetical protein